MITHSILIGTKDKEVERPVQVDDAGKLITKSILQDASGNDIDSHLQSDGKYHIVTASSPKITVTYE